MTFKKDYINYILHKVCDYNHEQIQYNPPLKLFIDKLLVIDDVLKFTFIVGKTSGMEQLFRYLLYISDKIDKSQITVFNMKDNFEYDLKNISGILLALDLNKAQNTGSNMIDEKSLDEIVLPEIEEVKRKKDSIKIEITDEFIEQKIEDETGIIHEEHDDTTSLTLIENEDSLKEDGELFDINAVKIADEEEKNNEAENVSETTDETKPEEPLEIIINDEINIEPENEEVSPTIESFGIIVDEPEGTENEIQDVDEEVSPELSNVSAFVPLEEIEIEISRDDPFKEESVTNEVYMKFENKFFEEVKILELLLRTIDKEQHEENKTRLSDKCLQSLTEVLEITSELSNLSRQLSFDLIADIFLTMNLYCTKAIGYPSIISSDTIDLFDTALILVDALIRNDDYLDKDDIVLKMEKLKEELSRPVEAEESFEVKSATEEKITQQDDQTIREQKQISFREENTEEESYDELQAEQIIQQQQKVRRQETRKVDESINFKLRYLVKEFEKSFNEICMLTGQFSKFDALDKIDELNNALKLIAKISLAAKLRDELKLAEVSYVFLKYIKDYRINLYDAEIQQIIKYIIFTFKMLLTDRKPDDFNVLVHHLNNPVRIFTE